MNMQKHVRRLSIRNHTHHWYHSENSRPLKIYYNCLTRENGNTRENYKGRRVNMVRFVRASKNWGASQGYRINELKSMLSNPATCLWDNPDSKEGLIAVNTKSVQFLIQIQVTFTEYWYVPCNMLKYIYLKSG